MPTTISIASTDVFTALRAFLLAVLPSGTEVIQSQNNGVPMPAGGFVAMNNAGIKRLSTNVDSYTPGTANPGAMSLMTETQFTMQLDFYGPSASAWAMTVQAMFRDEAGIALFPSTVQPLYCDDPMQIPLVTGEQQWLERWRVSAVMQIDPSVATTQDFAGALDIGLIDVTTAYPA